MEQIIAIMDISMKNTIRFQFHIPVIILQKSLVNSPVFFSPLFPWILFFPFCFLYFSTELSPSLPLSDNYGLKRCVVSQEADLPILPK